MSFRINTNIASLQAQEYLRQTSDIQQKTLGRVTSGLRILSSGDDAAGLAIANSFRSDQAVLDQGIRNANDGLSTLQTIDGGINNISKLLDRARTLAAQSASGAFTGNRQLLNSEFSSVITEIDRQAQSIGLNTGGQFAKSLSVFIGGGKAPDEEILQRTEGLIAQGVAGIVYGRNVIQHANPAGMTRALMSIVHDGATAAPVTRRHPADGLARAQDGPGYVDRQHIRQSCRID